MGAWLSLAGMWTIDNTIFDTFKLPSGIDKDTVINSILWESAELEVVLTSPESFKFALKAWSEKRFATWERIWKVLNVDYKPLENYNRTETHNINREKTGEYSDTNSGTETYTPNNTHTTSKTGFDSGQPRQTEQLEHTGEDVTATTGTGAGTSGENETVDETIKAFGNIGVMSSQTMLLQEVEVAQNNMIEIIVQEFIDSFCIMVY